MQKTKIKSIEYFNMRSRFCLIKKILAVFIVSICIVFGFNLPKASAIEYGVLGGRPANPDPKVENSSAWFIYNIDAGKAKQDAITVMNLFEEPLDVQLYPADSTNSSNGGFALKQISEPKEEVGSWVKFYPTEVPEEFGDIFQKHQENILEFCALDRAAIQNESENTIFTSDQFTELEKWCQGTDLVEKNLKGKENINIPFTITIPQTADTGEHTGGILIQKKLPDEQAGAQAGSTVKLTTRVGVRIYEIVPGEIIKKLSLDDFKVSKNYSEFSFNDWFGNKTPRTYLVQSNISNSGNVSVEHENNILIKNLLFGSDVNTVNRTFQVLKKDKFISNMLWNKPLFGYYSFQDQIKYQSADGEQVLLSDPIKVWIIPWREMSMVLLLGIIVFVFVMSWKERYKRKYGGIGWVDYEILPGDNVAIIAEKFAIDWKVFIKTNKLAAPYLLTAGESVLVPNNTLESVAKILPKKPTVKSSADKTEKKKKTAAKKNTEKKKNAKTKKPTTTKKKAKDETIASKDKQALPAKKRIAVARKSSKITKASKK